MHYTVIAIVALMSCIVVAILDDIFNIISLRKRVKVWFQNFKGVING